MIGMKKNKTARKLHRLLPILALCILVLAYAYLEQTKTVVEAKDYAQKLEASALAQRCMAEIAPLKEARGVPINTASDINNTGLIGQDYSLITTTLGNLEAKRTSTNPNMAAVVIDMLHELGLKPGDKVAINCSGSFPALNLAVLCAVQTLDLDPLMISSFGASTHGANDPELTYLDMEHYLYEKGLLRHKSDYFSIGGMEDVGKEMDPDTREAIVARLKGLGYPFLWDSDLLHNVEARFERYNAYGEIACFINVGGNDVAFGDSSVIVHTDGGVLTELSEKDQSTGLVQLFLKNGTPVIHLLNVKSLAADYGLPIDPTPLPQIGEGGVYFVYAYQKWAAAVGVLAAGLCLALFWRLEKRPPLGSPSGGAGREAD